MVGLAAYEAVHFRERALASCGTAARLTMRLLAFSDLHRDLARRRRLVELSADADLVIGAGDFASVHEGLEETIDALAAIETPTLLVPGNNETDEALREAAASWPAATVLHGEGDGDRRGRVLRARRRRTDHALGLELRPLTRTRPRRCWRTARPRRVLVVHSPPARPRRPLERRRAPRQYRDPRHDRAQAAAPRRLRPHPRELGRRVAARADADRQPRAGRDLVRPLAGSAAGATRTAAPGSRRGVTPGERDRSLRRPRSGSRRSGR